MKTTKEQRQAVRDGAVPTDRLAWKAAVLDDIDALEAELRLHFRPGDDGDRQWFCLLDGEAVDVVSIEESERLTELLGEEMP